MALVVPRGNTQRSNSRGVTKQDTPCTGCHLDFAYTAPHKQVDSGDEWQLAAKSACKNVAPMPSALACPAGTWSCSNTRAPGAPKPDDGAVGTDTIKSVLLLLKYVSSKP